MNLSFCCNLLTIPVSSLITDGLCKITGYESLRHSTSLDHWISIAYSGADLERAQKHILNQKDKKFFVLKDSEIPWLNKIYWPRYYAVDRGQTFGKNFASRFTNNNRIITAIGYLSSISHLLFPPTIRFIYKKSELNDLFCEDQILELRKKNSETATFFDIDGKATEKKVKNNFSIKEQKYWEQIGKLALETQHNLPNNRIGLFGLCFRISPFDIQEAWNSDRVRVIQGIGQLVLGIWITYKGFGALI